MTLCLEEIEENIHRRRMAKVVAKYGESPTVGMQLGRGHIDLSQESALEDSCVHEEERFFKVRAVVDTHEFPFPTR